ncbi:structure-specific recognition protein, putative [Entamoeba histolytica HM-1:IMSS-B]|uniref:FACT complex subunit SSRP1 n=5 Tax=Entamoeba histolytica TaxID=5759 RepID=C4M6A1_ENTH1|nr:structure specific recognition protein, putative [Entamoeba histolytica HM-1:IMSS]EMD46453.1 structure specific recognition protein, putative [Entamoeba histolytica KU27]EMH72416.1 structure-specific recognition protein, putative [Entamoeba histolytica HM-1:IMSS-B]ENY65422.1 structure specific recognition protein, putative [Entamoeba histolytica HM-1:IMSS-A]GAT96993.1 structure specific recognition protein putative [Entamoeba histolytica]EAL46446.1 structure specific recognition protein, pu|eukprot:XP_651832.1 structure specific recognition protein, putative [Entamoeba histolytica HM-1:IMSS]
MQEKEYCVSGFNWGRIDIDKNSVQLTHDGYLIFKMNPKDFTKSSISNKTEVSIEFDDSKDGDALSEIKFFAPQTEQQNDKDNATELYDKIAEVTPTNAAGKEVCLFENIGFLSPKGHYDVKIYEDSVRVQNKTYDFKINYKDIARYYKLRKDEDTSFFILNLSNPLKKGKSVYECLVMELSSNEEVTAELHLTKEFEDKTGLEESMTDNELDLFVELFRSLCNVPIISSGHKFKTNDSHFLKCNLSTNEGFLFPMSDSFIFVFKRIRIIMFKDIKSVDILRMNASNDNKTFDFVINLKGRRGSLQFTGMNRNEYENLVGYLKESQLKLEETLQNTERRMEEDDDSGDNDEEYHAEEEESGDDDIMSESEEEEEEQQ